jgi:hypothetical protein
LSRECRRPACGRRRRRRGRSQKRPPPSCCPKKGQTGSAGAPSWSRQYRHRRCRSPRPAPLRNRLTATFRRFGRRAEAEYSYFAYRRIISHFQLIPSYASPFQDGVAVRGGTFKYSALRQQACTCLSLGSA